MRDLLQFIGVSPKRLRLEWIATSEGNKLAKVVGDFTEEINGMGPSPLRKVRFKGGKKGTETVRIQA